MKSQVQNKWVIQLILKHKNHYWKVKAYYSQIVIGSHGRKKNAFFLLTWISSLQTSMDKANLLALFYTEKIQPRKAHQVCDRVPSLYLLIHLVNTCLSGLSLCVRHWIGHIRCIVSFYQIVFNLAEEATIGKVVSTKKKKNEKEGCIYLVRKMLLGILRAWGGGKSVWKGLYKI